MSNQLFGLSILLVLALFVSGGFSLRCWSCSSDLDFKCMDYFNTTDIFRYNQDTQQRQFYQSRQYPSNFNTPNLVECNNNLGQLYNTKPMCMKKVMTVPGGRQITMRECKAVSGQQQAGRCPTEPLRYDTSIDFCEFCDYDGCNGANNLNVGAVLTLILPVSLFLICRH